MRFPPDATLEDFEHVEEARIRTQVAMGGKSNKNLRMLLEVADEWREAGCTPVFIVAQEEPMIIACVAEETFNRPYN